MKMLSPIASIARGSVGGITFTANQFAQIVCRARTAPVQPGTVPQTKIKSAFTAAQVAWRNLAAAKREGWEDYSDTLSFSGPLGTYKVPGRQVFISNYSLALYAYDRGILDTAPVDTPPTDPGFLSIDNLNIDAPAGSGTGYQVVGNNNNAEDIGIVILNSIPFDDSRLRFKGPFKSDTLFGGITAAAAPVSEDVLGLVADKVYFCSVRAVSNDAPVRISPMYFLRKVAETTSP
jgi:hypothetical protein